MKKKILIGIQDYKEFITLGGYYVDKTKTIYHLLTENKYYFLSRPRRFGKSLTLSQMKYLYLGEKDLFKNTYIYSKWDFTKTNPVIYLSLAGYNEFENLDEFIKRNLRIYIDDNEYKLTDFIESLNIGFLIESVYNKIKKQVVVLVDEYDKVILTHLQDPEKAEGFRRYFGGFYSGVKDADIYIKMFLLSGLTKILKMNIFSGLNNLQDISFDPIAYDIMGYTWNDIETNFKDDLIEIQNEYSISLEEIKEKIQKMYNGYNFGSKTGDTIFNPWNINNLILKQKFEFYWSNTGIPSAIVDYVKAQNINVADLMEKINTGKLTIGEIQLKLERLDHIPPEVFFFNSGYLTIKKSIESVHILDYPNLETKKVMSDFFVSLVNPRYDFSLLYEISDLLYSGITTLNKEDILQGLNLLVYKLMSNTPSEWLNNNPEGWLKTIFGLVLVQTTMGYLGEVSGIKGRKDMVIIKDNTYFILEFKVDKSTKEAIAQIDKLYVPYLTDGKKIVKIGINWSRETKDFEIEIV